ncbi:hypothetical protein GYMLUDRAFT_242629 [Collybiopsis luxurians FD-317 M1]|uniref:Uncharacterized protein n=1 Tax=Collybiopsis luxurians FD-317 M1 TaxID=944289 RepID=A0A0D0BF85_9AGAR|nr:hypothetical protein GYMLUDRAFT_242629 [Collybiopsis luxurians FD-317 M1]
MLAEYLIFPREAFTHSSAGSLAIFASLTPVVFFRSTVSNPSSPDMRPFQSFLLFTLVWIWTSLLPVSASPIGDNSIHIRTGSQVKLPVKFRRFKQGTNEEHWMLVIGTANGFHEIAGHKLEEFNYDPREASKLIDLGCEAVFPDSATKEKVFKELVGAELKKEMDADPNSNCMDYVKAGLWYLHDHGYIKPFPKTFTDIYNKEYAPLKAKLFGAHHDQAIIVSEHH